ncbi:MAG: dihydroxyacetone kinase subunit DhaK [Lachnospiraceae bacterium]|nr:dihydroxyacetone kinase subunit DhaK [Lachnospiraceae bacterium]
MNLWDDDATAIENAEEGFLESSGGKFTKLDSKYGTGIYRSDLEKDRVHIIVNGGGGYGPMWIGFCGAGIADASVNGYLAAAPNAYVLYEMGRAVNRGKGVLFLTNNYMGDYLNNDLALELLRHDGIETEAVYITDDVFSSLGESRRERGGLHGIGQVSKIAMAAAEAGRSLEEVKAICEKANDRLRSLSINVRGGKMFFGEGISGEQAVTEEPFTTVKEMMGSALGKLLEELADFRNEPVFLSISNNREVSYTEKYILLHAGMDFLRNKNIRLIGAAAGTYFDNFQGKGAIVSLLSCDSELAGFETAVQGYDFVV